MLIPNELEERASPKGTKYWVFYVNGEKYICFSPEVVNYKGKEWDVDVKINTDSNGKTWYVLRPKKETSPTRTKLMILSYAKDIVVSLLETKQLTLEEIVDMLSLLYGSMKDLMKKDT